MEDENKQDDKSTQILTIEVGKWSGVGEYTPPDEGK